MLICRLRERGEATRPQLARASGLSLVTVGKIIAKLTARGLATEAGVVSSGGRPVQLYRFNPHADYRAVFRTENEGSYRRGTLEIVNLTGEVVQRETALFTRLQAENADDWLDAAQRRRRFTAITLYRAPEGMSEHLRARYGCPVRETDAAEALAEPREDTLTLALPRREAPTACLYRNGRRQRCGALGLLPQPMAWELLDYDDHTLSEEMCARLLLMLTCALCPQRIVLHADWWNERLITRLRFNLGTKLRTSSHRPELVFRDLSPLLIAAALADDAAR